MEEVKVLVNNAYNNFESKDFHTTLSIVEKAEDLCRNIKTNGCPTEEEKTNLLSSLYDFKGFIYLGLNDLNMAMNYFEKSINTNPLSSQALVGIAEICYLNDNVNDVGLIIQRIMEMNDNDNFVSEKLRPIETLIKTKLVYEIPLRHFIKLIDELIEKDQIVLANETVIAGLMIYPGNIDLLNNYGVILAMQNKLQDAKKIIEKILEIDPENQTALENRTAIQELAKNNTPSKSNTPANNPLPDSKNITSNLEYWQKMQDDGYFENHIYYGNGTDNLPLYGQDNAIISEFIELKKDMNIAVIGCGYGRESVIIGPHVKHIYGIDVNSKILGKAVKFINQHGVFNFTPVLAGSWKDDIKEEIDLVFELTVFQHLTKDLTKDYISGMRKKLSPDGKLLCQFLECDSGTNDAELKKYEPSVNWKMNEIEKLAEENNLVILKVKHQPFPNDNTYWHWVLFGKK